MMPVSNKTLVFALCVAVLISSCAKPVAEFSAGEPCDSGSFVVTDDFDGARRGHCQVYANGDIRVGIVPEDDGYINNSPWYSFKLIPKEKTTAEITLRYEGGEHRYWPKISFDGTTWSRLDESAVDESLFGNSVTFQVALTDQPVWVSAQMLVMPGDMTNWMDGIGSSPAVSKTILGVSTEGRPVHKLDINEESPEVIVLIGRQHPPEVSGSYAFQGFFESIVAETEVANRFRQRFHVVALPILNPDGVVAGNWRHNSQGVDLNRDWGPFTQVETKLVEDLLESYELKGKKVKFFVDFHSTEFNLMYTQTDDDVTAPLGFSNEWVSAVLPRLEVYDFTQEPRPVSDSPTGKNYMYKRYGVPAVTFEVADEEDKAIAENAAAIFAEEFMRLTVGADTT